MEIRNSVPSSGSYYPIGGGAAQAPVHHASSSTQKDQLVSMQAPPTRASLPRKGASRSGTVCSEADLEAMFRLWTRIRRGFLGVALGSLALFLIIVSLPILAIVFTLGFCLVGGCQEWWEFTSAVFMVCLWPGALFLIGLLGIAMCSAKMDDAAHRLPTDPMATDPLRFLARRRRPSA